MLKKEAVFFRLSVWLFTARVLVVAEKKEFIMLHWVVTFFIIAIISGLLGFTGIAGSAMGIAKILFIVFLILFIGSLILHLLGRK